MSPEANSTTVDLAGVYNATYHHGSLETGFLSGGRVADFRSQPAYLSPAAVLDLTAAQIDTAPTDLLARWVMDWLPQHITLPMYRAGMSSVGLVYDGTTSVYGIRMAQGPSHWDLRPLLVEITTAGVETPVGCSDTQGYTLRKQDPRGAIEALRRAIPRLRALERAVSDPTRQVPLMPEAADPMSRQCAWLHDNRPDLAVMASLRKRGETSFVVRKIGETGVRIATLTRRVLLLSDQMSIDSPVLSAALPAEVLIQLAAPAPDPPALA